MSADDGEVYMPGVHPSQKSIVGRTWHIYIPIHSTLRGCYLTYQIGLNRLCYETLPCMTKSHKSRNLRIRYEALAFNTDLQYLNCKQFIVLSL